MPAWVASLVHTSGSSQSAVSSHCPSVQIWPKKPLPLKPQAVVPAWVASLVQTSGSSQSVVSAQALSGQSCQKTPLSFRPQGVEPSCSSPAWQGPVSTTVMVTVAVSSPPWPSLSVYSKLSSPLKPASGV